MVTGVWFEPDDEHSQKPNNITTIRPELRMAMKNISIMTFWPQFWRVTWVSECEWLNSIPLWFCRFQSFKEQGQAHGKPCSQEHIQTEVEGSNQHYKITMQVQYKGLLPWRIQGLIIIIIFITHVLLIHWLVGAITTTPTTCQCTCKNHLISVKI